MTSPNSETIIAKRKEKIVLFARNNPQIISYIILAAIIILACYIRLLPTFTNPATGNPGLWDIAAGGWTLGPDLDPFLFLRWAKDIIDNGGKLSSIDSFRYAPLSYSTEGELILLPYSIAWLHYVLDFIGLSDSVTYSAIVFPVFFFALTIISFFLMTREALISLLESKKATLVALISSLFLALMPAILPRTIAGIPEKESMGFFFIFLSFFLMTRAWKNEQKRSGFVYALLAGLSTSLMALTWGGVAYIFVTVALAHLLALVFGKTNLKVTLMYWGWFLSSLILPHFASSRYTFGLLANSTMIIIPFSVGCMMLVQEILRLPSLEKLREKYCSKFPLPLVAIVLTIIAVLLVSTVIMGPAFILDKAKDLVKPMITPIVDRLGVTVAENKQPFFGEWASSFGPVYAGFPIFFWLFFAGSIALFKAMLTPFTRKQQFGLTVSYAFFLVALVFSRYRADSIFNGTNATSILFYIVGFLTLITVFGRYYLRDYKESGTSRFAHMDFGLLLLFSFFFFSIISARGSVRTIMVLVPTAAIMASFLPIYLAQVFSLRESIQSKKALNLLTIGVILFALLVSAWSFYSISSQTAKGYVPSIYTYQWQKAMAWVREFTPTTSVFAHWWDYGYWIQSIGNRATILDGGNAYVYWNHLMGRLVLTGQNSDEALEFLYAHNATHLLIDSTDIGKYSAFSSIGSDENYDRASYIPTFFQDPKAIQEKKNSTVNFYRGTFVLDQDIILTENNTRLFLPAGKAIIAGVAFETVKGEKFSQPLALTLYQGNQYAIALRYLYVGNELYDFKSGTDAGVFIFPSFDGNSINQIGAMLFLSPRVINSTLVRLYLFNQLDDHYKLVRSESDLVVSEIKRQIPTFPGEFLEYQGLRAPIRIWNISYPRGIWRNESYLETNFPNPELNKARL
jgi:asparagine N-glycosylation enzyme membrane subunit Stt3